MTLIPEFQIGLWNGWILSAIFLIINQVFMFIAPKENMKEMMDQVKELKGKDKIIVNLSFIPYYGLLLYAIFVPLKLGTTWFYAGLVMFVFGMIGEIIADAQLSFKKQGELMINGIYSISHNPIYMFYNIIVIGIGIATASWLILVLAVISIILNHYTILAEEQYCLKKYGDEDSEYMKKTPRYFGIPKLKNGNNNKA